MLTKKRVHRSVRRALRNKAKEVIIEFVKNRDNREIFFSILTGSMQKEIAAGLRKIYPLALCEIRMAKLKI